MIIPQLIYSLDNFLRLVMTQRKRDLNTILAKCWTTVYEAGPVVNEHWLDVAYNVWSQSCNFLSSLSLRRGHAQSILI